MIDHDILVGVFLLQVLDVLKDHLEGVLLDVKWTNLVCRFEDDQASYCPKDSKEYKNRFGFGEGREILRAANQAGCISSEGYQGTGLAFAWRQFG